MATTTTTVKFSGLTFTGDQVVEATVIEEFNPLAVTLPISTLDLTLFSEDQNFSILNPLGDYAFLKEKQPISIYETIDGIQIFVGFYFLSEWKNTGPSTINFRCIDQIGLLNTTQSKGGIYITPVTVQSLLDTITNETGIKFEIDPDVAVKTVSGWIPIGTHRDALQLICFAAQAYALSARQEGFIKIGRIGALGTSSQGIRSGVSKVGQSRLWATKFRKAVWDGVDPVYEIENDAIGFEEFSITQRPLVTGVEVTSHNYSYGSTTTELFNKELVPGTYDITFSKPYHTLSITGATLVTSGANFATVQLLSTDTVVITGKEYVDSTNIFGVYTQNLMTDKKNILSITKATLISSENVEIAANLVYDYYQERLIQKCKLLPSMAKTGSAVLIETLYSQKIVGTVEKMKIDLTRGFIISADVIGDVQKIISKLIAGVFKTGQSRNWQTRFRSGE